MKKQSYRKYTAISKIAIMALVFSVTNVLAGELLPFPSQVPAQQQYSQPYTQELKRSISPFEDKYAEFSQRISGYSCKDLTNLMRQLEASHANAQSTSKEYYRGLLNITNKKRIELNCTE